MDGEDWGTEGDDVCDSVVHREDVAKFALPKLVMIGS